MTVSNHELPIIDISAFLIDPTSAEALDQSRCLAQALREFSAVAIRDPRVSMEQNNDFLDLLEDYFDQDEEALMRDVREEFFYQVGATPGGTEVPKCGSDAGCASFIDGLDAENKPLPFDAADPKWRFFWRMGDRPAETAFPQLNAEQVKPIAFSQWNQVLYGWGRLLLDAVTSSCQMAALGFGMPLETFSDMSRHGPHLLAPTASKHGKVGTVLAGFHYDLNFLTIHGKSRFSGLHIWRKDGKKIVAKIPDGCLLIQAGMQMEWLTGGVVRAGYHEVCVIESTLPAIERQKEKKRPLWRISSTLFHHIDSDALLRPLCDFATPASLAEYEDILCGDHVRRELGLINLAV